MRSQRDLSVLLKNGAARETDPFATPAPVEARLAPRLQFDPRKMLAAWQKPQRLRTKKGPSVWDRRRPKTTPILADGRRPSQSGEWAGHDQRITLAILAPRASIGPNVPAPRSVWERAALDCLARLVEALDQGDGVEEALADALSILEAAVLV